MAKGSGRPRGARVAARGAAKRAQGQFIGNSTMAGLPGLSGAIETARAMKRSTRRPKPRKR